MPLDTWLAFVAATMVLLLMPGPTILLVGPSNEGPARRVVQAETGANGATNINAGTAKVVKCSWLA